MTRRIIATLLIAGCSIGGVAADDREPASPIPAALDKAKALFKRYVDLCKYSAEGERVRISCTRYSERKEYSSPISLLVGPAPSGEWLIFEELSESQP